MADDSGSEYTEPADTAATVAPFVLTATPRMVSPYGNRDVGPPDTQQTKALSNTANSTDRDDEDDIGWSRGEELSEWIEVDRYRSMHTSEAGMERGGMRMGAGMWWSGSWSGTWRGASVGLIRWLSRFE